MYKDKFKKVEYFEIEYHELDDIINQEYPDLDYECALDQNNDSNISLSIDGEFSSFDDLALEKLLKNNDQNYQSTRLLLNDMCRKGLIEKGDYLITICW